MSRSTGISASRAILVAACAGVVAMALEGASAASLHARADPDAIIQLTDAVNFCMILPPAPNLVIPDHEYDAVAYCPTGANPSTSTGNRTLPAGFVTAAHYVKTPGNEFAQVSGTYSPAAFGLFANDTGGQYDSDGIGCGSKGCPVGAMCQGYSSFIQMIGSGMYCLRCCNDPKWCPVDRDREGCGKVMGGVYTAGFSNGAVDLPTGNGTNIPETAGTTTGITQPVPPSNGTSSSTTASASGTALPTGAAASSAAPSSSAPTATASAASSATQSSTPKAGGAESWKVVGKSAGLVVAAAVAVML